MIGTLLTFTIHHYRLVGSFKYFLCSPFRNLIQFDEHIGLVKNRQLECGWQDPTSLGVWAKISDAIKALNGTAGVLVTYLGSDVVKDDKIDLPRHVCDANLESPMFTLQI